MATRKKPRNGNPAARTRPVVRPGTRRRTGAAAALGGAIVGSRPTTNTSVPVAPAGAAPRRRAQKLLRDARGLRSNIAVNFYRFGRTLRELSKPDCYRALGHSSFEALLEAENLGGRVTAFRLISIVDNLPQPLALELGVEKSYDAIRYARLAHPGRDVVSVIEANPRIEADGNRIPLSAISTRALAAAIRALRATVPPRDSGTRARRAARSLAQLLDHAGIDADRVRSQLRANRWRIRIDLSIEEAEDLATLLSSRRG